MRILLLSHSKNDPNGGASRIYHVLAEGLRSRGHEVTLRHQEDLGLPRNRLASVAIQRAMMPQVVSRLGRKLGAASYDVVMSSSGMAGPLFRSLNESRRPPGPLLVHHVHGLALFDHLAAIDEDVVGRWPMSPQARFLTGPIQARWDARAGKASDLTIVQNARDEAFVSLNSASRVALIAPGLSPAFGDLTSLPPGPAGSRSKLLWFASWEARKGSAMVAAAVRRLRSLRPEVTLTICGTGREPESLLNEFDPQDRGAVKVLGRMSVEDQQAVFREHHVFLFPSLSEGFGLALLEAMAHGLPAVAGLTGFASDHVIDGVNGMLCDRHDVSVADKVGQLLDDDDLYDRCRREGHALAMKFTEKTMVDEYETWFGSWSATDGWR